MECNELNPIKIIKIERGLPEFIVNIQFKQTGGRSDYNIIQFLNLDSSLLCEKNITSSQIFDVEERIEGGEIFYQWRLTQVAKSYNYSTEITTDQKLKLDFNKGEILEGPYLELVGEEDLRIGLIGKGVEILNGMQFRFTHNSSEKKVTLEVYLPPK